MTVFYGSPIARSKALAANDLRALADVFTTAKTRIPAFGPRGTITYRAPLQPGSGSTRTWTRRLNGKHFCFSAILMPNGERRYTASRYDGPEHLLETGTFACDWTRLHFIKIPPAAPKVSLAKATDGLAEAEQWYAGKPSTALTEWEQELIVTEPTICPVCGVDTALWGNLNHSCTMPAAPTGKKCACEHIDHESGTGHTMFGVPAGRHLAAFVGAVCDDCAAGHMHELLVGMAASISPADLPEIRTGEADFHYRPGARVSLDKPLGYRLEALGRACESTRLVRQRDSWLRYADIHDCLIDHGSREDRDAYYRRNTLAITTALCAMSPEQRRAMRFIIRPDKAYLV